MCGRYQIDSDIRTIIRRYDIERVINDIESELDEIKPTQYAPVIINNDNEKKLVNYKWGFNPSYLKRPVINSRMESIFEKRMFKDLIYTSKCLVPADYFYEWKDVDYKKVRHKIYPKDKEMFSMAGIFGKFSDDTYTYSIITTKASKDIKSIHDRMPVVIRREDEDKWIKDIDKETIKEVFSNCVLEFKLKSLRE